MSPHRGKNRDESVRPHRSRSQGRISQGSLNIVARQAEVTTCASLRGTGSVASKYCTATCSAGSESRGVTSQRVRIDLGSPRDPTMLAPG